MKTDQIQNTQQTEHTHKLRRSYENVQTKFILTSVTDIKKKFSISREFKSFSHLTSVISLEIAYLLLPNTRQGSGPLIIYKC